MELTFWRLRNIQKLLLAILILLITSPVFGATYYAQKAGNINADDVWFDAPSGGSGVTGATALAGTHTLYANTFAIAVNVSFTAAKISTAAGGGTTGGSFNVATSTPELTITAAIEAGTTTPGLTVTGTADDGANSVLNITGAITGGTGVGGYGVSDAHTLGLVVVQGDITGGSNGTAYGYRQSGATGEVSVTGDVTGGSASGCYGFSLANTSTSTTTITGTVMGGTANFSFGCWANHASGGLTVIGNLIYSAYTGPIDGNVAWNPAAPASGVGHYIKFVLGTDLYVGLPSAGGADDVKLGKYFIEKTTGVPTQGNVTSGGGGGAWGF